MRKELEIVIETVNLVDNSQVSKTIKPSSLFDSYKEWSERMNEPKNYNYRHTVKLCEEMFDAEGEHVGTPKVLSVVEIYCNHVTI